MIEITFYQTDERGTRYNLASKVSHFASDRKLMGTACAKLFKLVKLQKTTGARLFKLNEPILMSIKAHKNRTISMHEACEISEELSRKMKLNSSPASMRRFATNCDAIWQTFLGLQEDEEVDITVLAQEPALN